MKLDILDAISPIDGRYNSKTNELSDYFSEKALMSYRVKVESQYLIALSELPSVGVEKFSENEKVLVERLSNLSNVDAQMIKDFEIKGYGDIKATNHDVKAVEYFMKEKLKGTSLEDSLEWIHFALTSEDVNNSAYGMMIKDALSKTIIPSLNNLTFDICNFSDKYANLPMLSRTHGQPASPTTFGKEMAVYYNRLKRQLGNLEKSEILIKLNGATGNYNAHHVSYPHIDWLQFSKNFVDRLNKLNVMSRVNLAPNFVTTQIEPHDSYVEIFDNMSRLNRVLIDFNQDMWRYISDGWVVQKPASGEVGSSTMPHKVNPIDFENSEGNLGLANSLFRHFSEKLQISRLQRDLSDSTIQRNIGVAFAHSLIAYKSTLKGLGKMSVNQKKVVSELRNHPEVLTEAIQTVLRREGSQMPYEKLKELSRGKKVTLKNLRYFIDQLDVDDKVKQELKMITPLNYTGIARIIAEDVY